MSRELPAGVARPALRLFGRLPARLRRWLVRLWAPSYTVGAICVVRDDGGRFLLVRHVYRRDWGAPGGLVDRGEHPTATAVREVDEEVGLTVELEGEAVPVVLPEFQRIDFVFRCRLAPSADPRAARAASTEIEEVRWFAPDALPALQRDTAVALQVLEG